MKRIALMAGAVLVLCGSAGVDLEKLINQNVQSAARSYRQASPSEQPAEPVQLWIHIWGANQREVANTITRRTKDARVGGRSVEQKPVQTVTVGPRASQLRFFRSQDEPAARELFSVLRKLIPGLELKDLSREYAQVSWIKPGHCELWLAQSLVQLGPQ